MDISFLLKAIQARIIENELGLFNLLICMYMQKNKLNLVVG